MAERLCSNDKNYSAPMPIIGLYIAGASVVCLILLLCDVVSGLRYKTRYIPCRLFPLNSVSLTLLAIALKLPVDLTTRMPSAKDQLSKLTGTTMICICIGFMMPSLTINKESESITNLIALSILVVTIVVNICIQLATGVIFSFIVEHIMILCFMLMLLFLSWFLTFDINSLKETLTNGYRDRFVKGTEANLMHRVKRWYIYSSIFNPQLVCCRNIVGLTAEVLCIFCTSILSQAIFRSIVFHTVAVCEGVSDYEWSMWIIIVCQVITIIIGSLVIVFRWITLVTQHNLILGNFMEYAKEDFNLQFNFMKKRSIMTSIMILSRLSVMFGLKAIFMFILFTIVVIPLAMSFFSVKIVKKYWCSMRGGSNDVSLNSWKREFRFVNLESDDTFPTWMMELCVKDINGWMNTNKDSQSYMVQLLSKHRLSTPTLLIDKILNIAVWHSKRYKVTCLSMVLLVKVASASIAPSLLTESLRRALDEAFEVIYYIDEKTNVGNFEDLRKRKLAKLLWIGGDFHLNNKEALIDSDDSLRRAISTIASANEIFGDQGPGREEMEIIISFICRREYTSINELYDYIEELFVEMLRYFLSQLPSSIFKEVNECPIEDCAKRARIITKFLCKLDSSLEDQVQWAFPEGVNVIHFFYPRDHNENAQNADLLDPQDHAENSQSNISMEDDDTSIQDVSITLDLE